MARVLIIEDDAVVASSLSRLLVSEGHQVATAVGAEEGIPRAIEEDFEVIVTDLQMPGQSGLEVIRQLRDELPQLPVILMTAHHTTEAAIEATKQGAYEYILKPIDPQEFLALIKKSAGSRRLMSEPVVMGDAEVTQDAIVGKGRLMQMVYKEIGRVAALPVTVLIRGETGTGKELVARAIYQHSDRQNKPFIVVNSAALPETLLESELFGHEPGAFTDAKTRRIGRFEQADGGTLFLDEIGEISLSTQVKLLRILQDKTVQRLGGKDTIRVDVRILAATNRDLELAIVEKEFREDLYYRLNDAVITLPPLRERRDDITDLVRYFLRRHGRELGATNTAINVDALQFLQQQSWPGNVRELENAVRKALLLARGFNITMEHLREVLLTRPTQVPKANQTLADYVTELLGKAKRGELKDVHTVLISELERELYGQAFRLAEGDQSRAASWLGVSRPTMREKLTRYNLRQTKE